jgi:serine protease AprX
MNKIMKKIYFFIAFLASVAMYAQQDAWVYFNAKPDSETYLSNPSLMLSQRALDRRAGQGIALDIKDVPIHQDYIDQIESLGTVEILAKSKWLNALHIRGTQSNIEALAGLAFVDHVRFADVSLNQSGRMTASHRIRPVNKTMETQVNFQYGSSANQIQMLNGHLLHQQNFTGSGKIIAVLDAGFPGVNTTLPFKRLRDNNKILGGYNFVDREDDFYTRGSHGTMVLSTMGGYVQNQLVGTAPDASYYLFITEDVFNENPIEESLWVEAAEKADSLGVDVINTSLGYFAYDNPNYSHTYEEMDGITSFISQGANIAFTRGMIVVVSAGNSGNSADPHIASPADAVNVLTVGAVDADENYVSFSSIGPSADGRIKPDVDAQGYLAVVANPSGNVVTASGTSFSGPIMAGMIASFWQAAPNLDNQTIIDVVRQSAHLFENPTDELGYGIPDFQLALDTALLSVVENAQNRFIVYPNPVKDRLYVSLPDIAEAEMMLFNQLGQLVSQKKITAEQHSVDLETLANGIYLYKIVSAHGTQSGKLIKG